MQEEKRSLRFCGVCRARLNRCTHGKRCFDHQHGTYKQKFCAYCGNSYPSVCDETRCQSVAVSHSTVSGIYAFPRGEGTDEQILHVVRVVCAIRGMNCSEFFNPSERSSSRVFARRIVVAMCGERGTSVRELAMGLRVSYATIREDRRMIHDRLKEDWEFRDAIAQVKLKLAEAPA